MENAMKIDPRRVKITTAPAVEPITAAEAKLHCRVDHSTEDAIFTRLIETARIQCEDIARRAFITRTYTAYFDCWPYMTRFELPYPPLIGITSVKYYDDLGSAAVTVSASNYQVDTNSEPGRFALKSTASWPSTTLRELNGVEIIYTAGYGALAANVPARYKDAMFLLIAHYYEHREAVVVEQGVSLTELPMAVYDLLTADRGGWN
jgi:uncharacterized phiE125 gp8 family phage protein